nr:MAG TPA: Concanavalin A-like lectin/glucanase superfamily protein [Caudoviricetes sp.]
MVKEVKCCNRVIEITLDGTECAVKFDAKYNGFDIRNKSGKDITVSLKSGAAKGDDGVITIGDGETFNYMHMMGLDTVYITGSGAVAVAAKNEAAANFKAVRRGGGKITEVTPGSLGYAVGAKMFFDGIYNFGQKHTDNGAYWIDIVSNAVMRRYLADTGKLLLSDNHYVKETGVDSALRIPVYFNSDHFTTELFFEITRGNTSENDIINNFDHAGFGLFTENNAIQFGIFNNSSNAYQYINGGSYEQNTKYHIVATYNGENVIFYINGTIVGSEILALADYKKSTKIPYIGCVGGGGSYYSAGAYKFYRVAYYERALSQIEIINNYNSDIARFNV